MQDESGHKTISVAPMMDWTDRHCRYFHRLLSPHALLYTEMVTTGALLHGDAPRFLRFDPAEHPVVLQLGGSEPADLAKAAKMGEAAGYDEINLNCGCPSDRVQSGAFGACLMRQPARVGDCIAAMQDAVSVPVTVKCRIAVDEEDDQPFLYKFIEEVAARGCKTFIIHARKAWLQGLSPKENREVPPLRYDIVRQAAADFPDLAIHLNGGIAALAQIDEQLPHFAGIMIGREAYRNPAFLLEIERALHGAAPFDSQKDAVRAYYPYMEAELAAGTPLKAMTRHLLGLFPGRPGARAWRQTLSQHAPLPGADLDVVEDALARVRA